MKDLPDFDALLKIESPNALIKRLANIFPGYLLEQHVGYGTKKHLEAISIYKSSIIHRKSFKPISKYLPTFDYYFKNKTLDKQIKSLNGSDLK